MATREQTTFQAEPVQPVVSGSTMSGTKAGRSKKSLLVLIAIACLLIIAGTVYVIKKPQPQSSTNKAAAPEPPAYSFSQASSYKLAAGQAGTNATFEKPAGFVSSTPPVFDGASQQIMLVQPASGGQSSSDVARVALASISVSAGSGSNYLPDIAKVIANPNDPNYKQLISSITDFVSKRLPPGYNLTILGVPQPLTTDNLSGNAWIAGIAAATKSTPPSLLAGQVVIASGKQTVYYFMVENVSTGWQLNGAFWQQVIDSLKVDQ